MDPAERRELILSAARRAFASRPYEEVSLVEVASEAQASEALVHKYFAGKAGLYAQVLRHAADELAERTRRADDALPEGSSARRWVHAGCPDDQRHSLVDAALGCLEGALGDWRK